MDVRGGMKAHGLKLRNMQQHHFRGQLDLRIVSWGAGLLCLYMYRLGTDMLWDGGAAVHSVRLALNLV